MKKAVKILSDLVSIPSVNPMGRIEYSFPYGEAEISNYICHFIKKLKIDCEYQEVLPNRKNIIAYIKGTSKKTLLIDCHMDTVDVASMKISPFKPVIKYNKLYGRGACDDKGPMAAILRAMQIIISKNKKFFHSIIFIATADEEYQMTGSRKAAKLKAKADYGIAAEPTNLKIINAHKGVVRWKIHTKGKSVHSAYAEKGENAIYNMAHVLLSLEKYAKMLNKKNIHPVLGAAKISANLIKGGEVPNTVPDDCWIEIDRRLMPSEKISQAVRAVKNILPENIPLMMEKPYTFSKGLDIPKNSEIVRILADKIKKNGVKTQIQGVSYATDAPWYVDKGIPTVVFGPGRADEAHKPVEYIELSQLEKAIYIFKSLMEI